METPTWKEKAREEPALQGAEEEGPRERRRTRR